MALSAVSVAIMALSTVSVAELVEIVVRKVGISLKVEQKQCIEAVLQRKDVFPTGFGKSVIFHLLPLCCRCFQGYTTSPLEIVVAPIVSLMEDQIADV